MVPPAVTMGGGKETERVGRSSKRRLLAPPAWDVSRFGRMGV